MFLFPKDNKGEPSEKYKLTEENGKKVWIMAKRETIKVNKIIDFSKNKILSFVKKVRYVTNIKK